jgi:carboxylesterase
MTFQEAVRQAKRWAQTDAAHPDGNRTTLLSAGKQAKASVLMLHGFSASPWECLELARHLHHQGFNIFVPRISGHGGGRQEFESSCRQDWNASAFRAFEIAGALGQKLFVLGQSGGGVLATLACARQPEAVSGLVLAAPAFRLANPLAPLSVFGVVRLFIPTVSFPLNQPDLAAHWNTTYGTRVVAELVRNGSAARPLIRSLKVPQAWVMASRDNTVSTPFNLRLFSGLRSSQRRLMVYEEMEHNVIHHHNPHQAEAFSFVDDCLKSWL